MSAAAVRPMLATPHEGAADELLDDPRWVFERKFDGMRVIARIEPGEPLATVQLWSRNGHDKAAQFPDLVKDLRRFARTLRRGVLLDGEVVALDERGQPQSFGRLAGRIHLKGEQAISSRARRTPVAYVVFDVLRDGARDVSSLTLVQRRARLEKIIGNAGSEFLRFGEQSAGGDGRHWLAMAEREGWEGLIAKESESPYAPGRRSPAWRKLKLPCRQEFVIGGWTRPRSGGRPFGSLLLGYYDGDAPGERLQYAGCAGSGYDERELNRLWGLLQPLATDRCPFAVRPSPPERPSWAEPALVAEVKFTEWTDEGFLRHPVYLGLRTDVDPRAVRREPDPARIAPGGRSSSTSPAETTARSIATPTTRLRGRAASGRDVTPGTSPGRAPARPASGRTRAAGARALRDAAIEAVVDQLQALEDARRDGTLVLPDGGRLEVTNLGKVFWPVPRITKGELFRYYARISPWLLPVVADRPLIMKRFPNGVTGKTFYQQRAPDELPAGVRVEIVEEGDELMPRLVGGALTTLLYTTQIAAISQDPWFSRVQSRHEADFAALDLDPMPGVPFATVRDVARFVGDELARIGVIGVPKTSGSSGLHVYIPLAPGTPYEAGQLFCQIIATLVSTRHPNLATTERAVSRRGRTVYVDFLQNIEGKSLASAYSARASEFAGVSTPLRWDDLSGDVRPEDFTIRTAFTRFEQAGDLWAPLSASRRVDLRAALDRMLGKMGSG